MSRSQSKAGSLRKVLAYSYSKLAGTSKEASTSARPSSSYSQVKRKVETLEKRCATPKEPEVTAGREVEDSTLLAQGEWEGSGAEKPDLAAHLIDPKQIKEHYFSCILEEVASWAIDEHIEEGKNIFESHEVQHSQERVEHRFNTVCDLPIKLLLTPLSRRGFAVDRLASLLEMEFGSLHASLQVGNVILEWNDSSLVMPRLCDHGDEVIITDIQSRSGWVKTTAKHHHRMKQAAEKLDIPEQIDLVYVVTAAKNKMIDNLVEVIVRYNKMKHYNVIDQNCQHFVRDALHALEVKEEPIELSGQLARYYQSLISGCTPDVPDKFKTHASLDEYVQEICKTGKIDAMPQHDLEFLLAQYFRFHVDSKRKASDTETAMVDWKCQETKCLMEHVEKKINFHSLQIHKFR